MRTRDFQDVRLCVRASLGWIYLSRPRSRNALRAKTLKEMREAIAWLKKRDSIRAIILLGDQGCFCSGGDIREFRLYDSVKAKGFADMSQRLLREVEMSEKPVLCCVEGFALGAGCDLALSCDYTVAAVDAEFGWPGVQLGIISPMGTVARLALNVGPKRARALLLSGERFTAQKAQELGLIDEVVGRTEAAERTSKVALELGSLPLTTVKSVKRVMRDELERVSNKRLERDLFASLFGDQAVRKLLSGFRKHGKR